MLDQHTELEERVSSLKTALALRSVVLGIRAKMWLGGVIKKWMP